MADYDKCAQYLDAAKKSNFLDEPPETKEKFEQSTWMMAKTFSEIQEKHREAWEKEKAIRAEEALADDLPRVVLKTNKGDVTVELFENEGADRRQKFYYARRTRFLRRHHVSSRSAEFHGAGRKQKRGRHGRTGMVHSM